MLLDLGLPDMDGTDVITADPRARADTPIIVLSVRGAEREKVKALDLGADDYLTKPFGVDELLARVRVALRHAARRSGGADAVFRSGELEVDLEQRRVRATGGDVHLTPTEYRLLRAFIQHPDKLLTDRCCSSRCGDPSTAIRRTTSTYTWTGCASKIEDGPQRPRHLRTEPGVGYRLVTELK